MRIDIAAVFACGGFGSKFGDDLHGNAAGNFAGVVAAHAIGKHHEADVAIGANRILIVLTNTTGIGQFGKIYFSTQTHLYRATALMIDLRSSRAIP